MNPTFKRTVIRRRPVRRSHRQPMQGWGLVVNGAVRLGFWKELSGFLIHRAFAKTLKECSKGLELYMRAESCSDGVLTVKAMHSSASSDFHYIKDIVVKKINDYIDHINSRVKQYPQNKPLPLLVPIKDIIYRVGPIGHLPGASYWESKKEIYIITKAEQYVDERVVAEIGRVQDSELREDLSSLYSIAIAATHLPE